MRILLFGTYDTSMHPRVATIAEGLAASGLEVAEVNAPLGLDTAARVDMLARPWTAPLLPPPPGRRGGGRLPRPLRRAPGPAGLPPGPHRPGSPGRRQRHGPGPAAGR